MTARVFPRDRAGLICVLAFLWFAAGANCAQRSNESEATLPGGVIVQWDISKAWRETTPTRERVCINGLWRWQPASDAAGDRVPGANWGFFKVPGSWPGITSYMQKDSQTVHVHPEWKTIKLAEVTAAWYQREIAVPREWAGRRVSLTVDYLNSYATVFMDGKRVGELRYPAGELDLTEICVPGGNHVLSMLVIALPLKGVVLSYTDTASAKQVKGTVERRGLCGDVFLVSMPRHDRITEARIETSVRKRELTVRASLQNLTEGASRLLRARVVRSGTNVVEFTSPAFRPDSVVNGGVEFGAKWCPEQLWDIHTPENMHELQLQLTDADGRVLDQLAPIRFGFREFWIEGRDFYLNGTPIHLSAVPFDNAQVSAAAATYSEARESMERLRTFGINFVYTHNYGCEPGAHLSFEEILRAADDTGMLVALTQPHFSHYDWSDADADKRNGYARQAAFYARVAGNHPSVVMYSTSHNSAGYADDMNPDKIDGLDQSRDRWSANNAAKALRAEAIIRALDPGRIVYHHACGNLGAMHTSNFYPNFAPEQELCDWFEHWAASGVKPAFLCEYGAPFSWDWAMYRGWYNGKREFGSAVVPWEFCLAEWNAQFFGDRAFKISEMEKKNLRWEAAQFRAGRVWHRWDYPHQLGSTDFPERDPVFAMYYANNWRAYRTWGLSANSPWEHHMLHRLRPGMDRNRRVDLPVDWANLQRPGFSPDFLSERYERMDLAYERADWVPTAAAEALRKNNGPLLAWIAGKQDAFTSKDHLFAPGERVEKQIMVINDSRRTAACQCVWSLNTPIPINGNHRLTVETGKQARLPIEFHLPPQLEPGAYSIALEARFDTGEVQHDEFTIHVLPGLKAPRTTATITLFDPKGETAALLKRLGVDYIDASPDAQIRPSDILILGKVALTLNGPAPDVSGVRNGLRVLVFEQTPEVLEKRLGFRIAEYGLRKVFPRVPDHPALAGLQEQHLENWRGEATIVPPRMKYTVSAKYNTVPAVEWCGLEVPRLWRCGCRGNVASVLLEKPACGNFLPLIDGGFSLQYSPLLEYREGTGVVVFCQMDVTGRTEIEPAADMLAANLIQYLSAWKPSARRPLFYLGPVAGKAHMEAAGFRPRDFTRDNPGDDALLLVGPAAAGELGAHADKVRKFLASGGYLVALGLDQPAADALLPFKIDLKEVEHINAHFDPPDCASPFRGIGPADVHCRDARVIPLITGGAKILGDGVLGAA
ncbi:MAG: sugar-binding domain-containing protein, partial [Verrucomicrobiia bacterium]